jgi:hypothetical protein
MKRHCYVRASDYGTHAFCPVALRLKDQDAPTTLVHAQEQGTAYHAAHGQRVEAAARTRHLSTWMIAAAVILLFIALLLALR